MATSTNYSYYYGAGITTAASLLNAGISTYFGNKTSKYQQRAAKAAARIQANQYAAMAYASEVSAQRLAQEYGAQEYETIKQQESYLEDMQLDAAVRGGKMEGTNSYMISEQAAEFERTNYYSLMSNQRQQANYMLEASQYMSSAKNAIELGNVQADLIAAEWKSQRASLWTQAATDSANTWASAIMGAANSSKAQTTGATYNFYGDAASASGATSAAQAVSTLQSVSTGAGGVTLGASTTSIPVSTTSYVSSAAFGNAV